MLEIVNCPKCRTRMRSYMVDTAGAHYRCDFCGFLYPEDVHVTYGTSTTCIRKNHNSYDGKEDNNER